MRTNDFHYDLPLERIAQTPIEPRHNSRLLILDRQKSALEHTYFWDIGRFVNPGDLFVINQTRVIPARVYAKKVTGGKVELLLLKRVALDSWETLVGGKKMSAGSRVVLENGPVGEVIEVLDGPRRLIRFSEPIEPYLPKIGEMPLPPYIHERLSDPERYQTVFAQEPGSAAAPTAGLHFTEPLMDQLRGKGIDFARLTLHVGLDTFAPVNEDSPEDHKIHTEWCELSAEAAAQINRTRKNGGKIIAVGTTSVRTLETAARFAVDGNAVGSFAGPTDLFILPGYTFNVVDAMVTNFHLPKSTLLMLVSAFASRERILDAYQQAINEQYRFFSFGDAMLIL